MPSSPLKSATPPATSRMSKNVQRRSERKSKQKKQTRLTGRIPYQASRFKLRRKTPNDLYPIRFVIENYHLRDCSGKFGYLLLLSPAFFSVLFCSTTLLECLYGIFVIFPVRARCRACTCMSPPEKILVV